MNLFKTLAASLLLLTTATAWAGGDDIAWHTDLDSALKAAKAADKPLFLDFYAEWCGPCKAMDKNVYPDLAVRKQMEHFVAVRIDVDKHKDIAKKYRGNARAYGGNGIPAMIVIDAKDNELFRYHGYLSAAQLTAALGKTRAGRQP
ncbi:MAG: thioredoxin family protein [Porticoccaceae bacterium]|nr:thioredoxin family protein [Porticoccaceae bacterium]